MIRYVCIEQCELRLPDIIKFEIGDYLDMKLLYSFGDNSVYYAFIDGEYIGSIYSESIIKFKPLREINLDTLL